MSDSTQATVLRCVLTGLVTITLFVVASIQNRVTDIDTKLFAHLTNDEIHIPREHAISKSEFELYKKFTASNYDGVQHEIRELRNDLKEYFKNK